MVRVVQTGKDEYNCPKKCGPLKYGRSLHILQKTTHCKKCKGVMLTENDVKEWERKSVGPRKNRLKKNNLFELLKSGTSGTLDCPKCSKKIQNVWAFGGSRIPQYHLLPAAADSFSDSC